MNHWHQYPFVRLVIPFITGIIIGLSVGLSLQKLYISGSFSLFCLVILFLYRKKLHHYSIRWLFGIILSIFLVNAGASLTLLKKNRYIQQKLTFKEKKISEFTAIILNPPIEKENSFLVKTRILAVKDSVWKEAGTKAILYFEKDSASVLPEFGNQIIVSAQLQQVPLPKNPGEFNYSQYLADRGVFFQAYVRKNIWRIIDKNRGSLLLKWSFRLRNHFLGVLKRNGLCSNEFDIAAAILLGYDAELDPEMKQQFAGAGAMHILCVSGLHVGIIYLFFSVLLGFLKRVKYGTIIKALVLIIVIWFYALLTGMAPSVLRAATMFTFVSTGQTFKRYTNIYNTLAASAFFLLLVNPFMLREVGFQLSYAAVFSIVWIQPFLSKMLVCNNKILKYFFDIFTVSIAAQLGTFPLAIYYFHQFPNYFIITNLIVIPLSFLIVLIGLIVALFSFWAFLSAIFTRVLSFLLFVLDSSVAFIHSLPGSVSYNLRFDFLQLLAVYLIIFMFFHFLKNKRYFLGKYVLASVVLLIISFSINRYKVESKQGFIVYDIPGHTAIEFYEGNSSIFLADSNLLNDNRKIGFHIQGNRVNKGIQDVKLVKISETDHITAGFIKKGNILNYNGTTILLADQQLSDIDVHNGFSVDYLIVVNSDGMSKWKNNLYRINADIIIISSSLKYWQTEKITQDLNEIFDSIHIIAEYGFFREKSLPKQ